MKEMIKNFETGLGPMTGTGIKQLTLGIGSIQAGNTLIKLKAEVQRLADQLLKANIITKEQRKKILSLKCAFKLFWIRKLRKYKSK